MQTAAGGFAGTAPPQHAARHQAVGFDSPADLATRLAPMLRDAVGHGDPVVAVLGAAEAEALRAALGDLSGAVDFDDPREVHSAPAFTVAVRWARAGRRVTRPGGRAIVLGQRIGELPGCDTVYWARMCIGVDIATDGLPVSVLCPFPATTPDLDAIRSTHPVVTVDGRTAVSPGYRRPDDAVVDHPPPPPPDLGEPAARLRFGPDQLSELRHLVTGVAAAGGLSPERVADVVLAVNELASNSVEHGAGAGVLRMWNIDGVVAEVTDSGRMHAPFAGMTRPPPEGARGRGLWLASELCDVLQVWSDDEHGTVIRVRADR